ncbi:Nicotinate-nucleotide--dimethylbenzimidazole phosphoribosyltransferase [Escherichia coli]|uniref:Nicotinate-nucleotide--dimethylbenzimidazole phosphoribosyltransferase n=1 Tax=Escherichia coli TaxID=562 RepID=A0A377DS41_ECOLX|nr:Nicotinate-nucleotide--dimethylbenzimidazole phosphoribosyltransferase [Escherichia coli]
MLLPAVYPCCWMDFFLMLLRSQPARCLLRSKPYLIPSHLSAEKGARIALSHLGLEPYLNMEMRLGEGSGAALAMPIIEAACAIYNNMGELAASNIVLPGNTTSDLNS